MWSPLSEGFIISCDSRELPHFSKVSKSASLIAACANMYNKWMLALFPVVVNILRLSCLLAGSNLWPYEPFFLQTF